MVGRKCLTCSSLPGSAMLLMCAAAITCVVAQSPTLPPLPPSSIGCSEVFASHVNCDGSRSDPAPRMEAKYQNTLVTLEITGYKLSELTHNPFGVTKLVELKTLDLTDNEIMNITASAFTSHLPKLQLLILDHNQVSFQTTNKTFNSLEQLEELSLNNALNQNLVNAVAIDWLKYSLNSEVANIPKLKILNLRENALSLIPPDMFDFTQASGNQPKLETIDFSSNRIAQLFPETFNIANLPHLKMVNLSHNNLRSVDKLVLDAWKKYSGLMVDLSNNTWACDCNLEDFRRELQASKEALDKGKTPELTLVNFGDYICSPTDGKTDLKQLENLPIVGLTDNQLICTGAVASSSYQPTYVVMGLLVVVISLCLLVVVFLRRRQIRGACSRVWDTFKKGPYEGGYAGLEAGDEDDPEASEVFL